MATFVLPALVTVWVAMPSLNWFDISKWVFFAVLAVLAAGWILLGYLSFKTTFPATALYVEHTAEMEGLRAELGVARAGAEAALLDAVDLREGINTLSLVAEVGTYWTMMLNEYVLRGVGGEGELKSAIEEVLSAVIERRDRTLGIEPEELWNFAVYYHDGARNMLRPILRVKHERHPSHGNGREWPPGLGHVGLAFVKGEAVITSDATDAAVAALLAPPGKQSLAYDNAVYVSLAAIPIPSKQGTASPLGVLVGTSNRKGRFTEKNSLILAQAAPVLACVMSLAHISSSKSSS